MLDYINWNWHVILKLASNFTETKADDSDVSKDFHFTDSFQRNADSHDPGQL